MGKRTGRVPQCGARHVEPRAQDAAIHSPARVTTLESMQPCNGQLQRREQGIDLDDRAPADQSERTAKAFRQSSQIGDQFVRQGPGMLLGLGSGTTSHWFVRALGAAMADGLATGYRRM